MSGINIDALTQPPTVIVCCSAAGADTRGCGPTMGSPSRCPELAGALFILHHRLVGCGGRPSERQVDSSSAFRLDESVRDAGSALASISSSLGHQFPLSYSLLCYWNGTMQSKPSQPSRASGVSRARLPSTESYSSRFGSGLIKVCDRPSRPGGRPDPCRPSATLTVSLAPGVRHCMALASS